MLCHKQQGSRSCELAAAFLKRCIEYQVENRRCDPLKFVPCGSISPLMRKFLTKMLIVADNMHIHLGKVGALEREMSTDDLIATVDGTTRVTPVSKAVSASSAAALSSHDGSRSHGSPDVSALKTPRIIRRSNRLSGIYTLEKMASPFHIPAELLRPCYEEWKVSS